MGFLDFAGEDTEDPRFRATSALAQALLGAQKGGGMLALSQGLAGYQGAMSQARDSELKRALLKAQIDETMAQGDQRKASAVAEAQKLAQARARQRAIEEELTPQSQSMPALAIGAQQGSAGPTMANAQRMDAMPAQPRHDWRRLIAMGVPIEQVKAMAEADTLGKPKVARTVDTVDAQGRPVTIQLDEQGRPVGDGMRQWKAPVQVDQGDRRTFMDPTALAGQSFGINQSPDSRASNAIAIRGQNMVDARSRESSHASMTKPFEVTGPDGSPVLVQQDRQGNIVPVAGYSPKGGTSKPLPQAVVKQVTEARDNAATIDRLTSSFKPQYAEKGVFGLGADASLAAKAVLGTDKDSVEWWKNYRKESELVERHALFGASLTAGEQSAWKSADISPGLDPKVIERNLQTRARLAKRVLENTRQDMIDAGHSDKRVNAISNRSQSSGGVKFLGFE